MSKSTPSPIEDRASAFITDLISFRARFKSESIEMIHEFNRLSVLASDIKRELNTRIYALSDQISNGVTISREQVATFQELSVTQSDSLINEAQNRQRQIQEDRICRRITLVMLNANITNTLNDIESMFYQELTPIQHTHSEAIAVHC